MKHPRERKARAFSLVEIAIALGVVAFALTAIVSLLSLSLESESQSRDDIVISTMITQVMADLRRQDFSGVFFTSGTTPKVAGMSGTNGIFPDTSGTFEIPNNTFLPCYYFDHSGVRIIGTTQSQAVASGAVYQCYPTITTGTIAGASLTGTGSVALLNVGLSFYWPASAISNSSSPPTNAPNSRTVYTSIARY